MSTVLDKHQQKLIVHRGSPQTKPALTPGVQFDPPEPDDPWWMKMEDDGLQAAKNATSILEAANLMLETRARLKKQLDEAPKGYRHGPGRMI